MKYKQFLLKLHFGLLLFVLLNFILRQFTEISLSSPILFVFKLIIYTSGIILLFLTIKPFEKKAIYFSIYLLSPLGVLLSWFIDGMLAAVVGSLFFWTISTDDFIVKNDYYKISRPFAGFMGSCCKYNIEKNYFYLAEKKIGSFRIEASDLSSATFTVNEKEDTLNLHYQFKDPHDKMQSADTSLVLK